MLHPQLGKAFQYDIERKYIAITSADDYFTIHSPDNLMIYRETKGHFCHLNNALYPRKKVNWCVLAFLINNKQLITKSCQLRIKFQTHDLAYNLGRNTWVISTLAVDNLQTWCFTKTHYVHLKLLFQVIIIPNSCEAYSSNICLTANTKLSMQDS